MPFPTLRLPALQLQTTASTLGLLIAAFAALPCGAAPANAVEPEMVLSSGKYRIAQLRVGDSLAVEIGGRQPFANYHFVLSDDQGTVVAQRSAKADGAGRAAATPLWANSGVVGCDPCGPPPDGKKHRYRSYRDAEAALDGRHFEVTVLDDAGKIVSRRRLRVHATGEERAFFSDADACPRLGFRTFEPVYLSFQNLPANAAERRFFLVAEPAAGLTLGAPLEEVRDPLFPQLLDLAEAGSHATFLVWIPGSHDLGTYSGVVRDQPTYFPHLMHSDLLLGPGDDRSAAGLSITVDSTGCPPG